MKRAPQSACGCGTNSEMSAGGGDEGRRVLDQRFGAFVLPAPRFRGVEKRPHEARVQGMARLVSHKAATNGRACQREVANGVQELVANEFVVEAKPFRI